MNAEKNRSEFSGLAQISVQLIGFSAYCLAK
jgi:hypothetical protein